MLMADPRSGTSRHPAVSTPGRGAFVWSIATVCPGGQGGTYRLK
jgi:hypothetical protein